MKRMLVIIFVVFCGFIFYSCSTYSILVPAPAPTKINNETTKMTVDNITVTLKTNQWNGNSEVNYYVTPLLITIDNNTDTSLKISYQQFALIAPDGERFSALPPFEIRGTVEKPLLLGGYGPFSSPFYCNNFFVAPWYSGIYMGFGAFDGPFYYDPFYYNNYYGYWNSIPYKLPTQKMLLEALPEGVLKKNGTMTGFLYFQKVHYSETRIVKFRFDLINVKNGNAFGTLEIPLDVLEK